jgi:hypothetical protein
MRSLTILPLAAAMALAGCGNNEQPAAEKQAASQAEVKAAMDDMPKPMPGQYRSTMKLVSVDIPGMPASQAEKMKGMLGASEQTSTYCLSQAEADRGFEESTKKLAKGNCNYERFSADGGKLDAKLKCNTPEQGEATMEMVGDVRPDGTQLKMTMQGGAPGLGGNMKMVMEVAATRIGDCT